MNIACAIKNIILAVLVIMILHFLIMNAIPKKSQIKESFRDDDLYKYMMCDPKFDAQMQDIARPETPGWCGVSSDLKHDHAWQGIKEHCASRSES